VAKPGGPPIAIGLGAPFSGPLAAYGPEMQSGIEVALRDVNRQVLGRPLELKVEDTETKPDVAARKLESLVTKDGANFVIGWASSAEALAIVDQVTPLKAVFLATVAQTTRLTGAACNKYTFRSALNDAQYMNLVQSYLEGNSGLKSARWAILAADYEYGRDSAEQFKLKTGIAPVSEEYPALGSRDFATFINKLQSVRPDYVFLPMVGQDLINFLTQADSFGLLRQMKFLLGTNVPEFVLKPLGDKIVGVQAIANYTWTIDTPENKRFTESFGGQPIGDLKIGMYGANTYLAARLLFQAIEKAGEPNQEKVIAALENLEWQSPWGRAKIRKEDHQLMQDAVVAEVERNTGSPYGVALKPIFTADGEKITPPMSETGCRGL
jgi:branched-chain amino acid transport system substrate-binding protein